MMEKQAGAVPSTLPPSPGKPPRSSSSKGLYRSLLGILIAGIGYNILRYNYKDGIRGVVHHQEYEDGDSWASPDLPPFPDWSSITPSENLSWQPCFGVMHVKVLCARLTVPMDYHRPLNESAKNPKVHLALVLVPGANRTDDPSSYAESPMLINPGGPGGSGALMAASSGNGLQRQVGEHHDIVGFDPRGVGATTPKADCFQSSDDQEGLDGHSIAAINRLHWMVTGHDVGIVNSSNVALSKLDARSKAVAKLCKRIDEERGDDSIFRFASTSNVARDMLSIIDAWDEWRSTSTSRVRSAKARPCTEPVDPSDESQTAEPKIEAAVSQNSTKGKLVYWGFSYGTLLGATFASMFPDRVGRVILDGVVDADHYVNPSWMDSIQDADEIWDSFFTSCAEAGPPRCRFALIGDTPERLKHRFDQIMAVLQKQPAIVLLTDANMPSLFTASDLKLMIFTSLYSPRRVFPLVANILRAIADGNLGSMTSRTSLSAYCHSPQLPLWPDDATKTIACSDKRYKLDEDIPALEDRFKKMASYSSFADVWMSVDVNIGCNGWPIESRDPPMRWDDHPAHKPEPIVTDFPVLFLSNRLDPVTPLHAALKMTRKFANASVVEQGATGHCSSSCQSSCTLGHIRAYLNDGVVPPQPKFDSPDEGEWAKCSCEMDTAEQKEDGDDEEEQRLASAYRAVHGYLMGVAIKQHLGDGNPLRQLLVQDTLYPTARWEGGHGY
ncbi:TAP-like protein-domain-containing protein [Xylariomycetidae sp. FL2044]|nr:TAP-like protein-domain-containing protein [Xylariomycetidae sp. FL2044]